MHFAIDTPNFGEYADPRLLAQFARDAEDAGWDGFFLWDHIGANWPYPVGDPWIQLAAMAMTTERIKLGTTVTPLPRRRPWQLARQVVSLDHLSAGRVILGVGIGSDSAQEYSCFGESPDDRIHAAMLDEGLAILTGLWRGEPFSFQGVHYQLNQAQFLPAPVQVPRIPIWLAGIWPHKRPFRRAAQWDGICPIGRERIPTPEDVQEMLTYIRQYRQADMPFDVVLGAYERDGSAMLAQLADYAEAGVTWWLECFDWDDRLADVQARIRRGPPRR
jgi:alkanesulfonate monooxygenase SsuD/methylene tetrahydromethanopterin reductase-like flavin-dependent oxidoreductase (luciferase family)